MHVARFCSIERSPSRSPDETLPTRLPRANLLLRCPSWCHSLSLSIQHTRTALNCTTVPPLRPAASVASPQTAAHHAAGHQHAAPRQQLHARVATAPSKTSALAGFCPASSQTPSDTALRSASHARPLLHLRPIKGDAELSFPASTATSFPRFHQSRDLLVTLLF